MAPETFVLLIMVFAGGAPAVNTDIHFTDKAACEVAVKKITHQGGIGEPTIAAGCIEVR